MYFSPTRVSDHQGHPVARCHINYSLRELSLDPADVLLEDLAVPDLLLHVARLARVPTEHQQPRRQPGVAQREEEELKDHF